MTERLYRLDGRGAARGDESSQRAGRQESRDRNPKASGSFGLYSIKQEALKRAAANVPAVRCRSQGDQQEAVAQDHPLDAAGAAPRAMRKPISDVRRATA